ncbi:MAG: cysteine synthase A [Clostridia bacterium]|nr:cysteine synthase A [Clostridia bacterium]
MKVYSSIEELIGRTPLLRLEALEKEFGLDCTLLAKLESFNPGGSAKDRVAVSMLDAAEREGIIGRDAVIIEPTSGNTGIGLSLVGAARGYRVIIVMPDTMSVERIQLMSAYGAEVVLSDGKLGMKGAIAKANELAQTIPGAFIPGQFDNPANPTAHYLTTGPEIYADTDGEVDIFVAGIGTGGTITGVGKYLKEHKPGIKVIGVEPAGSPYLSEGRSGAHGLQGIGAGFAPSVLDKSVYDEILTVTDADAYACGKLMGKKQGVLVGISAGAALSAAVSVCRRPENKGKTVVVLLPDTGEHYFSTELYK